MDFVLCSALLPTGRSSGHDGPRPAGHPGWCGRPGRRRWMTPRAGPPPERPRGPPAPDLARRWLAVTALLLAVTGLVPPLSTRAGRYVLAETAQPACLEAGVTGPAGARRPLAAGRAGGRAAPRALTSETSAPYYGHPKLRERVLRLRQSTQLSGEEGPARPAGPPWPAAPPGEAASPGQAAPSGEAASPGETASPRRDSSPRRSSLPRRDSSPRRGGLPRSRQLPPRRGDLPGRDRVIVTRDIGRAGHGPPEVALVPDQRGDGARRCRYRGHPRVPRTGPRR